MEEDDAEIVHPLTKLSLGLSADAAALWIEYEGGSLAVSARADTLREVAKMLIEAADKLDQVKLN